MEQKKNDNEKSGFLSAVLGVFLVGTVVILLILTLVLLSRNGTFARMKEQIAEWKAKWELAREEKRKKEDPVEPVETELTHFGPSDGKIYDFWELFSWIPEAEKTEEPEIIPDKHRELAKNPVNGTESWWKDMTKLSGTVMVYAEADTPLYGAPDKATEVFGYTLPAEEFRLFAVTDDGWYVVTDGDFYYCSEGVRYTMTVPESVDFTALTQKEPVHHTVKNILQKPELPYGCEVTSLAMLFSWYGINADKCVLSDSWLPKGAWGTTDFRKAFVGNPRNRRGSAGCYAEAIAITAENYLDSMKRDMAVNYAEGVSAQKLIELVKEAPVLVWTTMELKPSYIAQVWPVDGQELLWQNCEHCVVLTGYDFDKGVFYGEDPLYGSCEYDMQLFYLRYATMFSQAVWLR